MFVASRSSSPIRSAVLETLEGRRLLSTTIYEENFNTTSSFQAAQAGATRAWSNTSRVNSPNGSQRFAGQFGQQSINLSLGNLPAHDLLRVSFDLYVIRSWDGNANNKYGPDHWTFKFGSDANSLETVKSYTFCNNVLANVTQDYPTPGSAPQAGAAAVSSLGYNFGYSNGTRPADATYRLTFDIPHADAAAVLSFVGGTNQTTNDESWGIDNLAVETSLPSVTIGANSVTEGEQQNVEFTLMRDPGASPWLATSSLEVELEWLGGPSAATLGEDFVGSLPQTVTFLPGEQVKVLEFVVVDDEESERIETLTACVKPSDSYSTDGTSATVATGRIYDNDAVLISIEGGQDGSEDERTPVVFRLIRKGATTSSVSVRYELGGSAVGGDADMGNQISSYADYLKPSSLPGESDVFEATIPSGADSADLVFEVFNDHSVEVTEEIDVLLLQDTWNAHPSYMLEEPNDVYKRTLQSLRTEKAWRSDADKDGNVPTAAQLDAEYAKVVNPDPTVRTTAGAQLGQWLFDYPSLWSTLKTKADQENLPAQLDDTLDAIVYGNAFLPEDANLIKPHVGWINNTLRVELRQPYQYNYILNNGNGRGDLIYGTNTAEVHFLLPADNTIPLEHGDTTAFLEFVPLKAGTFEVELTYEEWTYANFNRQGQPVVHKMKFKITIAKTDGEPGAP